MFFAEKAWDFDLDDEIPEQIEIEVQGHGYGKIRAGKRFVKTALDFAFLNMLTGEFIAYDLRAKAPVEPLNFSN